MKNIAIVILIALVAAGAFAWLSASKPPVQTVPEGAGQGIERGADHTGAALPSVPTQGP